MAEASRDPDFLQVRADLGEAISPEELEALAANRTVAHFLDPGRRRP